MLAMVVPALLFASIPHTPSLRWKGDSDELFGAYARLAGDLDGDGFGDVLVYAVGSGAQPSGSIYAYSGRDGSVLHTFEPIGNSSIVGVPIDGAGDLDGDGFGDVLIGDSSANVAKVYSGRDGSVIRQFNGEQPGDGFGGAVRGIVDVNGDGVADLMIGTTAASFGYAKVYSGSDGALLQTLRGHYAGDLLGASLAAIGDVNGDGVVDFAVGAVGAGRRYLNPGFPPFVPPFRTDDESGAVTVFSGADGSRLYNVYGSSTLEGFGFSIARLGDLNGDGVDDFAVGTESLQAGSAPGYVRVVSGRDGATLMSLLGDPLEHPRLIDVSSAGDVDGDSIPDLLVAAIVSNPSEAQLSLFSGRTGALLFAHVVPSAPPLMRITADMSRDIDGDGLNDFVLGVQQAAYGAGFAELFRSRP